MFSRASFNAKGFTLLEVMVALAVMAIVAVLTAQSFHTASRTSEAILEAMERMAEVERALVLLETDLKYAIDKTYKQRFGDPLPPLYVSPGDDYWMTVMRGSVANPLFQARTEEVRVGYRYLENEIWRDTWFNPTLTEEEDARPQKVLTGVENLNVRVLSNVATSLAAGPWHQDWPARGQNQGSTVLPKAVEITLELEDMGEIVRLYSILPGVPDNFVPQPTNPGNDGGRNNENDGQNTENSQPENTGANPGGVNR